MALFLCRIGTILTLTAALAPADVSNRDARSEPRSERRDEGRPAHAFRTVADRSAAADKIGAEYTARVVGIADGDTIRVLHENGEVRIRLHGIDCPEKGQAFGTRAKQFTADLVFGQDVRIRVRDVDRYGRTVAEVWLEDGRMLNRELVDAGLAWWYRQYAPYDETMRELEREAREAGRGLWAEADPVAPWEWRHTRVR
jgi:endonuclease YncB( thermonuclease family)